MKKTLTILGVIVTSGILTGPVALPAQTGICDYLPFWACSPPDEEPCGGKGHHELCP